MAAPNSYVFGIFNALIALSSFRRKEDANFAYIVGKFDEFLLHWLVHKGWKPLDYPTTGCGGWGQLLSPKGSSLLRFPTL